MSTTDPRTPIPSPPNERRLSAGQPASSVGRHAVTLARASRWLAAALVLGGASGFVACGADRDEDRASSETMLGESASALAMVADARGRCLATADAGVPPADAGASAPDGGPPAIPTNPLAGPRDPALAGYRARGASLEPTFTNLPTGSAPRFTLGRNASSAWTLEDATSGVSARVSLRGAAPSAVTLGSDGVLVYPDALGTGAHMFMRAGRTEPPREVRRLFCWSHATAA